MRKEIFAIVSRLNKEATDRYLDDSFFSELIESALRVNWNVELIADCGPSIEEVIRLLNDFNRRVYNRASQPEITVLSALLMYFTKMDDPEYEDIYDGGRYKDIDTQKKIVNSILITVPETIKNYRKYQLLNGLYLKDIKETETSGGLWTVSSNTGARKKEEVAPAEAPKQKKSLFEEDELAEDIDDTFNNWSL